MIWKHNLSLPQRNVALLNYTITPSITSMKYLENLIIHSFILNNNLVETKCLMRYIYKGVLCSMTVQNVTRQWSVMPSWARQPSLVLGRIVWRRSLPLPAGAGWRGRGLADVGVAAVPGRVAVSTPVPAVRSLLHWYRGQGSAGGSLRPTVAPPVSPPLSSLITH